MQGHVLTLQHTLFISSLSVYLSCSVFATCQQVLTHFSFCKQMKRSRVVRRSWHFLSFISVTQRTAAAQTRLRPRQKVMSASAGFITSHCSDHWSAAMFMSVRRHFFISLQSEVKQGTGNLYRAVFFQYNIKHSMFIFVFVHMFICLNSFHHLARERTKTSNNSSKLLQTERPFVHDGYFSVTLG